MSIYTPTGEPKHVRCYKSRDDVADPYTVVFCGNFNNRGRSRTSARNAPPRYYPYLAMNAQPLHPSYGFCQHGEGKYQTIDRPTSGHLGKKIKFTALPEDCQKIVRQDYREIWGR